MLTGELMIKTVSMKSIKRNKSYFSELKKNAISLPSALLIFYAIPVMMCLSVCKGIILRLFRPPNCFNERRDLILTSEWLQSVVIFCLHPIAGWVTDTKIGRNKTITMSLWFCWCGTIFQVVSYCIQYSIVDYYKDCNLYIMPMDVVARFILSVIALVLLILGISGYQSNILAYGMDQLPDASTNQIRKFVRWLTWSFFMGYSFNYTTTTEVQKSLAVLTTKLDLGTCFATFLFVSVALILHSFLRHKFHSSGTVKRNPYTTVAKVLKYAWNHKRPKNRSALTYWENKIPSRIDLGKDKYGGPFTEGDVEDTKTFWRMVAVFCSLGGVFIPYFTFKGQAIYYGFQFVEAQQHEQIAYVLWQTFYQVGVFLIPLLDLVVLPLFPKIEYFFMNSFKGFMLAMLSLLCAMASLLTLEGVAVYGTHNSTINNNSDSAYSHIKQSYLYFIIPWVFISISYLFTAWKSFEFICSQAPKEMSGMLTGVYWLTRACYISIGALIVYIMSFFHLSLQSSRNFWVILVQLCVCIAFSIILALVSKWYQKRQREQKFPFRSIVEEYYSKYVHPSYNNHAGETVLFSKYDLPINGWSDDTIPVYPSVV